MGSILSCFTPSDGGDALFVNSPKKPSLVKHVDSESNSRRDPLDAPLSLRNVKRTKRHRHNIAGCR
ncbi:hypothetical protein EJ06DRAFT_533535 [Trichodelitschia bisporula]|uniref:Uncharacterized protein n=1 Tax=Trichodelitschia bisporula TaxID=703511 RepID=A0A6G1HLB2_9PEZI|nr:hypothetical protein EJ06DRAFT_533535 [Trichodelitschia bisporula]